MYYNENPIKLLDQKFRSSDLEKLFENNTIQMKCRCLIRIGSLIKSLSSCLKSGWGLPDGTCGRYGIKIFSRQEMQSVSANEWELLKNMSESFHWKYLKSASQNLQQVTVSKEQFHRNVKGDVEPIGWYTEIDRPIPHYKNYRYHFKTTKEKEEWQDTIVSRMDAILNFRSNPSDINYYQLTSLLDRLDWDSRMDLHAMEAAVNNHIG
eukprot:CAMPEP_0168544728 /NCGR_PEP_ID=MMETSP0413-20121227/2577_1 /TAXON_ID=136452 /ORGANISM="Filamoeba nolandi, Strain NC-AS-23-1" /LENGTH=207 /DNA_ID=CAMNT_0008574773 /DNA_START=65 /DNA_END=685 /DNA_ORIENTATION=-